MHVRRCEVSDIARRAHDDGVHVLLRRKFVQALQTLQFLQIGGRDVRSRHHGVQELGEGQLCVFWIHLAIELAFVCWVLIDDGLVADAGFARCLWHAPLDVRWRLTRRCFCATKTRTRCKDRGFCLVLFGLIVPVNFFYGRTIRHGRSSGGSGDSHSGDTVYL